MTNLVELDDTALGYADVVIDFYNSGSGPIDDAPYGGSYNPVTLQGTFPVEVSLSVVLGAEPFGDDTVNFLSLPSGSYVTVGFLDEVIVDGEGDDIFVTEIAGQGEEAEIYVGTGSGEFFLLGSAFGGETASFDLADINYTGFVNEVRIVGLNNAGGSPGYDVVNVIALTAGLVDLSEDNDLIGTDQDDVLDLQQGDDRFEAGNGDDSVGGGKGSDTLLGQSGDDLLEGGKGKDTLKGGDGKDLLRGGDKNDELQGGKGKDTLDGGKGNDELTGGKKSDTFVFSKGDDVITDFDATDNKEDLDLSKAAGIKGINDLSNNHMTQVGNDVVIEDADGSTVTLLNVMLDDLGKADFIF